MTFLEKSIMRTKLLGTALFALTATAVILIPMRHVTGAVQPPVITRPLPTVQAASIEVVFVLDTTGSMSGLIEAAKEKIWSIASSMAQAEPAPQIRMGLVAYRDRGDRYVTRVTDLSSDLDSVYATLMDYRADGGGDGPESVNRALHDALHRVSWSRDQGAYQVVFLVGDAPPHMDYQDEQQYPQIIADARQRGIVINTIQAGASTSTGREWRRIASLAGGEYFQVDTTGSAVAVATPYDEKLARLSEEFDATRLYYGDPETRAGKEGKLAATRKLHESASVASRARRATFNMSESGAANRLGENELVDDVTSGRVDIGTIPAENLPEPLQAMAPSVAKVKLKEVAEKRRQLRDEIRELAQQRSDFLTRKVEEGGGADASLDARIYGAVREQATAKGIRYEAAAPAY
jgi:Mg-chelatase subunit ChlD